MKITSTSGNVTYLEQTRKNEDSTQKEQGQAGYFQQFGKESSKEKQEEPSKEELEQALQLYGKDPTLQALGLEAAVEGRGPGLRVTLKDGSGTAVRQYTGQEFLELREAAQLTGRGKLLDKKV